MCWARNRRMSDGYRWMYRCVDTLGDLPCMIRAHVTNIQYLQPSFVKSANMLKIRHHHRCPFPRADDVIYQHQVMTYFGPSPPCGVCHVIS